MHRCKTAGMETPKRSEGSSLSSRVLSGQVSRRKFLVQSGIATAGVVGLYTTPVLRTVLVGPAHAAVPTPTPGICTMVETRTHIAKGDKIHVHFDYTGPGTTISSFVLTCDAGNTLISAKIKGESPFWTGSSACGSFTPNVGVLSDKTITGNGSVEFAFDASPTGNFSGCITLGDGCTVEFDTQVPEGQCTGKMSSLTMLNTGAAATGAVTYVIKNDIHGSPHTATDNGGGSYTFLEAGDGDLDTEIVITKPTAGGDVVETIHTSCSAPVVVGQPAPWSGVDGHTKGDPSANWEVQAFVVA